jgi:hypothetical protein
VRCWACGAQDDAYITAHQLVRGPGSICLNCAALGVLDNSEFTLPTVDELAELHADSRMLASVLAVRIANQPAGRL